jgi:geranylgeranylglycerol-phosphate geranylgeranyltransferase
MAKVSSFLKLTRLPNGLIAFLSVIIGAWSTNEAILWGKLILAGVSAFLIASGGNVINDYFDIEIDKINRPKRVLAQKEIEEKAALLFSIFLFWIGFILSFFLSFMAVCICLAVILLLIFYSYTLKKMPLIGNLAVSLVSALAFVYGGILTTDFRIALVPAGLAFLFHLGREIIKDMEDQEGDKEFGVRSFPLVFGNKNSLILLTLIFSFLILFTIFPFIYKVFSLYYFLVVVFCVDLVLVWVMVSLWKNSSKENLNKASQILKIDMLFGLLAIFLGRIK